MAVVVVFCNVELIEKDLYISTLLVKLSMSSPSNATVTVTIMNPYAAHDSVKVEVHLSDSVLQLKAKIAQGMFYVLSPQFPIYTVM